MTVNLSALAGAGQQFFDNNGNPLSGGKLWSYEAGTTTPQDTYTTSAGNVAHTNPIILDSAGRVSTGEIWLIAGDSYKIVLTTSTDVLLATWDNIVGINDVQGQITAATASIFADLSNTDDADKGDAIIGFKQANMAGVYTNAVGQTVHRKLQERVSVFDFMSTLQISDVQTNTAVLDVSAAINYAFAAIISNKGGTLYFPKGTYLCKNYVGNVAYTQNDPVDIGIECEEGAQFNFLPNSEIIYGFYLQFPKLRTLKIDGIKLNGNDLIRTGIWVTGDATSWAIRSVDIQNCFIENIKVSGTPGAGRGPAGITVSSTLLGYTCNVSNNVIETVRGEDLNRAGQGIQADGFAVTTVTNNYISNVVVDDNVGDPRGSGIGVFNLNTSGRYSRSEVTISGNFIRNCGVYFVKLQTNGACTVANNLFRLDSINRVNSLFAGVDSQAGDATIENNTYIFTAAWTSLGTAQCLAQLQSPASANVVDTYEPFFQRFENNQIYIKNRQLPFGVIVDPPRSGVQCISQFSIVGNMVNSNQTILQNMGAAGTYGLGSFIYANGYPSPTNTTGQWLLKVSNNNVMARRPLFLEGARDTTTYPAGNDPAFDYSNKWFMFWSDNVFSGFGNSREITALGQTTGGYTSTCMFRDNSLGTAIATVSWPMELSKLIDGCDFRSSNQTLFDVPANYINSRIVKKAGKWVVHYDNSFYYISNDATTWADIA